MGANTYTSLYAIFNQNYIPDQQKPIATTIWMTGRRFCQPGFIMTKKKFFFLLHGQWFKFISSKSANNHVTHQDFIRGNMIQTLIGKLMRDSDFQNY